MCQTLFSFHLFGPFPPLPLKHSFLMDPPFVSYTLFHRFFLFPPLPFQTIPSPTRFFSCLWQTGQKRCFNKVVSVITKEWLFLHFTGIRFFFDEMGSYWWRLLCYQTGGNMHVPHIDWQENEMRHSNLLYRMSSLLFEYLFIAIRLMMMRTWQACHWTKLTINERCTVSTPLTHLS